ncbi:flippase [Fictibacillus sp. b24]|uniref:flippase n=1 Tax=Fictibacillus sp. b24 TaxID=3055863 RepID=UPI0025A234AF|nr:flippase [Fictibacillus sp. b24]MDM5314907.1 flippase [Fictibacillus sp. b24]
MVRRGLGKSLYKNSIYYILYRVINVIYPLVTATYVSRILKPEGVGEIAVAQTVVIFLVACASLGIPNYGVREISKRSTRAETSILFSELFITNFISTLIISVCYYSIVNSTDFIVNKELYNILGIIILLNIINVDWFYQGKEEFKYITLRSSLIKFLSVFAIFAFVKNENDIFTYATIFVMAYVGNYLFNIVNLRKYAYFTLKGVNPKKHLKFVAVLAITFVSNEVYVTVDTVMLGIMSGNSAVGYYSNAIKLINIIVNVCSAMGIAVLPKLSRIKYEGETSKFNVIIKKAIQVLLWFTLPSMVGLWLTAEYIIAILFGKNFYPSIDIMKILCLLVLLKSFSNLFLQVLLSVNKDTAATKVYFSAMIFNISLNSLLIPIYSGIGAAIASVMSELFICIALLIMVKKDLNVKIGKMYIISLSVALISLIISVKAVGLLQMNQFNQLMISMVVGAVSYMVVCIIMKNDVVQILFGRIYNRYL